MTDDQYAALKRYTEPFAGASLEEQPRLVVNHGEHLASGPIIDPLDSRVLVSPADYRDLVARGMAEARWTWPPDDVLAYHLRESERLLAGRCAGLPTSESPTHARTHSTRSSTRT